MAFCVVRLAGFFSLFARKLDCFEVQRINFISTRGLIC